MRMTAKESGGTPMNGVSGWFNPRKLSERELRYSEKVWNGPLRYYEVTEV
jgi:hypothetical protein